MQAESRLRPLANGMMPGHVAHVIRAWRRRVGLTQEGLAQALNVTFSTVSRWENGHVQPSKLAWRALQQLAAERGCPLDSEGSERSG
jgi:DNA-binding transcriptional regulator YiaG